MMYTLGEGRSKTQRMLYYIPNNINNFQINTKTRTSGKNQICIQNIQESLNEPGAYEVTLILGEMDDKLQRYVMSNNGYITIQVGVMYQSRHHGAGYVAQENSYRPVRNLKKHPNGLFKRVEDGEFTVRVNNVNGTNTLDPIILYPGSIFPNDIVNRIRTEKSANNVKWRYYAHKIRFRYVWEPGNSWVSPYILNSDELWVNCNYENLNIPNLNNTIHDDEKYTFVSSWGWEHNDGEFHSINNGQDSTNATLIIIPKFDVSSYKYIGLSGNVDSEEECDGIRFYSIYIGDRHNWHIDDNGSYYHSQYNFSINVNTSMTHGEKTNLETFSLAAIVAIYHKDGSESNGQDSANIEEIWEY